jgi:lipopolysaccharide transport system ATP-binding protein
MSDVVLRVDNLGKQYRLGQRQRSNSLRESFVQALRHPLRRLRLGSNRRAAGPDRFWALRQVSFDVEQGEVVGIIGSNGAGKSTLLKILSRITEPTQGRVELTGRVGSLLEVGTGFHPELTGRENVYLNGAILGMCKAEIARKFDEIVAFAEVEKFIDTPVKHYSSGMYMRLAFSVAAHLESEILLVDEVLAVGDAAFQKKCLGKMGDVARQGRTVLFVSHNTAAVMSLCSRAVVLRQGQVAYAGVVEQAVSHYVENLYDQQIHGSYLLRKELLDQAHNGNGLGLRILDVQVLDGDGRPVRLLSTGDSLRIRIDYDAKRRLVSPAFLISLSTVLGVEVVRLSTMPIGGYFLDAIEGTGTLELRIDELPLVGGTYLLTLGAGRSNLGWEVRYEGVGRLHVQSRDVYGSGVLMDQTRGLLVLRHQWNHAPTGSLFT